MVVICSIILSLYCLLVLVLLVGWVIVRRRKIAMPADAVDGVSALVGGFHQQEVPRISIIVAMRNESSNIEELYRDLSSMAYAVDKFEIIFVNDHSTDDTHAKVKQLSANVPNIRIINLPEGVEGKKSALQAGIEQAEFEIIATTDADCRLSKNWLHCIALNFKSEETKMVVGAVKLIRRDSFFSRLQVTEFISLVGATASAIGLGHPVMCNGANLSYRKNVFLEVSGFQGNLQIASGDDEFLMRKIFKRYPSGIVFLNFYEAVISSHTQKTIRDLFYQRLRWAGKWKHNSDLLTQLLAVFIFVSQISFIVLVINNINLPNTSLALIVSKLFLEGVFLLWVGRFLERKFDTLSFIALQLFYPFYVTIIGLTSLLSSYHWKGRNYN
ncbi:glycosyltransferase [soil metagenome]